MESSTAGEGQGSKQLKVKQRWGIMRYPASLHLKHIFNRNDKSEHITYLDNVVRIIIVWSEWRDLNSRPLDPQSSALPTALHPDGLLLMFRSQLVYINTPFYEMQVLFSNFLKKFRRE